MADFYDQYLSKKSSKSQQQREFESFLAKHDKRFHGYDQFLFTPEKIVNHKNQRLIRFDDVDMGDEVEAAIYNDGRQAPQQLKKFVNIQMNRIMSLKMNQIDQKLRLEDMYNKE